MDDDDDDDETTEIVVLECSPADHGDNADNDGDSEDEGWYSLSRTDVRKLQQVRSSGGDVNIILTNPDILTLCNDDDQDDDQDEERDQQPSPERTSYR